MSTAAVGGRWDGDVGELHTQARFRQGRHVADTHGPWVSGCNQM